MYSNSLLTHICVCIVPPEATPVSSTDQIVLTNSTMTLSAFIQIISNPVPVISWTGPDGQPRNNNGRFNTSIPGQLIISNIVTDDNGTYTCTIISNGIGQDLTQSIDMIIASEYIHYYDHIWCDLSPLY